MIDIMLCQERRVISLTVLLSMVMMSPVEFSTGEFHAKKV